MEALGHLQKLNWSGEALRFIARTLRPAKDFDPAKFVRDGVASGRMEMWQVNNRAVAVTEAKGDTLHVHAYQGQDVKGFARMFHHVCKANGLKRAQFHCDRPALIKLLADYQPKKIGQNVYEVPIR